MPKYIVEIWETRSFEVHIEADDEDAAKDIATEDYDELSYKDEFVSVEFREIWIEDDGKRARRKAEERKP
jgi:hypothetical protein